MVDRDERYVPLIKKFKGAIVDGQRSQTQSGRLSTVHQKKAHHQQIEPSTATGRVVKRDFVPASLYFKESAPARQIAVIRSRPNKPAAVVRPNRPSAVVSSRPSRPAAVISSRPNRLVTDVTSIPKRPDRPNVIQSSRSVPEKSVVQVNQRIAPSPQKSQDSTTSPIKEAQALLQLSGDVQESPRDGRGTNLDASSATNTSTEELISFSDEDQYGRWYIVRNGKVLYTCIHCEYTSINVATFKRHVLVKHDINELEIKIDKKKPKPEKKPKPVKPPKKPEIRYDPGKPAVLTTVRTLQK